MNGPEHTSLPESFPENKQQGLEPAPASVLQSCFSLLTDSILDYAFIAFDLDNRVIAWNRGAERMFGYSTEQILHRSGALLFTAEDQNSGQVEKELATARKEGRAEDEHWHVRNDGSLFWGSGVMTLLQDKSGQPIGFVKVVRDLTARKAAEEALRESESRFRLFVENVRDHALFQVDPSGCISGWNSGAERLFGYTADEILGRPFHVLFPPEDRDVAYPEEELARTLAEGKAEDARWLVRRDGTRFFAAWVTHPMFDEAGQLRGYAKVLRDETERLRAEQSRRLQEEQERAHLRRAVESTGAELDRTKDELRALAASLMTAQEEERRRVARELHDDVSQGLAILEMQVLQLQSQPEMPAAVKTHFDRLRSQISAVTEGIRTLGQGLHPSTLEHLGLVTALRSLGSEFEKVHNVAFHLISFPLQRTVRLSVASALYRIAQEALGNVAKHAPGSLVTMRVTEDDNGLHLSIQDTGPGFDPAASQAREGIGLMRMQERARLIGGTFALYTKPGTGAQISITVPQEAS